MFIYLSPYTVITPALAQLVAENAKEARDEHLAELRRTR